MVSNALIKVDKPLITTAHTVVAKKIGKVELPLEITTLPSEINVFTLLDDDILNLVYASHVHKHDDNFDVESLFVIAESIIKRTNHIVDYIVQGAIVHAETIDDKQPKSGFTSPFCTLKSISSEISCKPPGEGIAHKSVLEILSIVSNYSWDAKAVLALAAFALDYGDFWLLAHGLNEPNQLVKSLAILRRIPVLLNPADLKKRQQAIVELNELIKAVLQVIEILVELKKLTSYDQKDVPALADSLEQFPVYVYWVTLTVIACSTKISILTNEEEKVHELAPYAQKVHYILNKLKIQLIICKTQIEEAEYYRKLTAIFQTPTEVKEIIKALIFYKETVEEIFDGSTQQSVSIEVLKQKNVFLFFSSLEITDEDIDLLRPIHEFSTKNDGQYTIVWVPIVETWTDELKAKFETLRSKIPWYVVQIFSPIWGVKFIKKEWKYKGKPIVVVLNVRGKVENLNALHLIRVWGIEAFPYSKDIIETISKGQSWIAPIINNIDPIITTWIKEERYIFFYGGTDSTWVQDFAKKVAALASDSILKDLKISIELYYVGKTLQGGEDLGVLDRFWSGIESLFLTKTHKDLDIIAHEIQKLLSYKNESGWALVTKGSKVVFASHGLSVLKIVEEFSVWRDSVKENGFEITLVEYHSKIADSFHFCSRLEIPSTAGIAPKIMSCPECPRVMETYTAYKCCHVDDPKLVHH